VKFVVSEEADAERAAVVDYYLAQDAPQAALRFDIAVDQAFALIRALPHTYRHRYSDEQVVDLKRFPYAVVYYLTEDTITIIAIAHHKRLPAYWRSR
jgi:toxin ParE1/3/4